MMMSVRVSQLVLEEVGTVTALSNSRHHLPCHATFLTRLPTSLEVSNPYT